MDEELDFESPDLLDYLLPPDEEPELDPYDYMFFSDDDPEPTSGDLFVGVSEPPVSLALESTSSELPHRSLVPPATVSEKPDPDIAIGRTEKRVAQTKEHDLKKYEEEIQRIVLQTAACGYMDIVHRALSVLHQVNRGLKRSGEGLNFCEGKGKELLWKKQVQPFLVVCYFTVFVYSSTPL